MRAQKNLVWGKMVNSANGKLFVMFYLMITFLVSFTICSSFKNILPINWFRLAHFANILAIRLKNFQLW